MEKAALIAREIYKEFKLNDSLNELTGSFEQTEKAFIKAFKARLINELSEREVSNEYEGVKDTDIRSFNEVVGIDGYRFGGVLSDTPTSKKDASKTLFNIANKASSFITTVESIVARVLKAYGVDGMYNTGLQVVIPFSTFDIDSVKDIVSNYKDETLSIPININTNDNTLFTKDNILMNRVAKSLNAYVGENTDNLHTQPIILPVDVSRDYEASIELLVIYDEILKGGYDINNFERKVIGQRLVMIAKEINNFIYLTEARVKAGFLIISKVNNTVYVSRRMMDMTSKHSQHNFSDMVKGAEESGELSFILTSSLNEDKINELINLSNVAKYEDTKFKIEEVSKTLIRDLRDEKILNGNGLISSGIDFHEVKEEMTKRVNGGYESNGEELIVKLAGTVSHSTKIFTETVVTAINTFGMEKRQAILIAIASILATISAKEIITIKK